MIESIIWCSLLAMAGLWKYEKSFIDVSCIGLSIVWFCLFIMQVTGNA